MAKKNLSYSESIGEIENILKEIENEEIDIDILSEKVKRAAELIASCKSKLTTTEKEIEEILKTMK
jgi:exodeoxyribonuclease VII small subunit